MKTAKKYFLVFLILVPFSEGPVHWKQAHLLNRWLVTFSETKLWTKVISLQIKQLFWRRTNFHCSSTDPIVARPISLLLDRGVIVRRHLYTIVLNEAYISVRFMWRDKSQMPLLQYSKHMHFRLGVNNDCSFIYNHYSFSVLFLLHSLILC